MLHRGSPGRQALARNGDEEVEKYDPSVAGAVDEHEAPSSRTRQRALGNPTDERGRDAGVDGVPAFLEDPSAGLRGERMTGRDRALHGRERSFS
jgi:hypothetical protein